MCFSPVSPPVVDLRTIMEIEESRQKCGATPKLNLGLVKNSLKELCFIIILCPKEIYRLAASLLLVFCVLFYA